MKKIYLFLILVFSPLLLSWSEPYEKIDMTNLINNVNKVELIFYDVNTLKEATFYKKNKKIDESKIKKICEVEPVKIERFKSAILDIEVTKRSASAYIKWYSIFMYTDDQIIVFSINEKLSSYISVNSISIFDKKLNYVNFIGKTFDFDGYVNLMKEYFPFIFD